MICCVLNDQLAIDIADSEWILHIQMSSRKKACNCRIISSNIVNWCHVGTTQLQWTPITELEQELRDSLLCDTPDLRFELLKYREFLGQSLVLEGAGGSNYLLTLVKVF